MGIRKRAMTFGIALILCTILLVNISIPGSGEEIDDPPAPKLGFDGNMTAWIEQESDTATGSEYMLYDNHGGWWADAEKIPGSDGVGNPAPDNPGDEDDLLCWAATVSNMLEWTGWGFVESMDDTDEFLDYFEDHTTDYGSTNRWGIEWWFNGNLYCPGSDWSSEDVAGGDFWSSSYTWSNYLELSAGNASIMPDIRTWLTSGYAIGLGIYPIASEGGHAITCWGFNYNPAKNPVTEPDEYYRGIWVSDSDSHKSQTNADDYLRYYEVEWDSAKGYWYMPSYGSGWVVCEVNALHPFPGESRPTASDGGPYNTDEGTAVSFDGSGSSDDDTLKYRWDVDGDGDWDTSWSTSSSTSHTWYDDYTGDVYLEVFDDRLRDMDVTTVTINNVPPTATASVIDVDENGVAAVYGSIVDPGTLDTFTIGIDWGEGSPESFSYPAGSTSYMETHQYLDDDPTGTISDVYSISVTVTDDDGGACVVDTQVTVNNIAPVITTDSMDQPNPQFILPLIHTLDFEIEFTDTGTLDTHTAVWDWDDSTTSAGTVVESGGSGTVTGSHVFSSPGTYDVEVTVTDDDGGSDSIIITVVVVDADEAIEDLNDYIQDIDDICFKNTPSTRKNAFDLKISVILGMLEDEKYEVVIIKLTEDIRDKADGLVDGKKGDDWVTDQTSQDHICMKIDDIIEYLELFI